jgi:hypothetical protein
MSSKTKTKSDKTVRRKLTEAEEQHFQAALKEYSTLVHQYDIKQLRFIDFTTKTDTVIQQHGFDKSHFFSEVEFRARKI